MILTASTQSDPDIADWQGCACLTCSVLPVRMACNCRCPFCFSRSSISALEREFRPRLDLDRYFADARERGATRLVVTGGGEPLLRKNWTIEILRSGKRWFDETALFTNASLLDEATAQSLIDA